MEIELRTFANFRAVVGETTVRKEYDAQSVRAEEVLRSLDEYPEIELFDDDGTLQEFVGVLKNGREITHLDGLDTVLEDGDTLSVFPPAVGG